MTSQVCIHFALHMAEATFAFLHHLRQQYLVKVILFVEIILYFIKNFSDKPVQVAVVSMKNVLEVQTITKSGANYIATIK